MFWMKQRKSTAKDFLSPSSSLPRQHPVSGEYGRLDSPWRVRSHLQTLGQPKAGTVTITQPQSLWALTHWVKPEEDGTTREKLPGWGGEGYSTCHYQWQGWATDKKQLVSNYSVGFLWPTTGLCRSVNQVERVWQNPFNLLLKKKGRKTEAQCCLSN